MAERRRRRDETPTARPRTVDAMVPTPGKAGGTVVQRVLDSVLQLRRSGQITLAQYEAAERYRDAYEAVRAGMGGVMDPDRVGGGSALGRTPSPAAMYGADTLADATRALSRVGGTVIVEMIVGQGYTIDEAARSLFPVGPSGKASRRNRDHVGAFLRLGLGVLAGMWFGTKLLDMRRRISK